MSKAVVFSGSATKNLKPNFRLKDAARILTGSDDPTVVATEAEKGSIYLRQGATGGQVFYKLDDGTTTNWRLLSDGSGWFKADLYDPVSTTLPVGVSATVDGESVVDGDLVYFTNLGANNDRLYQVSGVGVALVWTALPIFGNSFNPTAGDSIRVIRGDMFAGQTVYFDGSTHKVNDIVRYFDGDNGTDFYEQTSIKTLTLTDNTVDQAIFSVGAVASENMTAQYSILRGTKKETGQLIMTYNGISDVSMTPASAYTDPSLGVTFAFSHNAGNLELKATIDNQGTDATLKYFLTRWSDSAGGPTGAPSYSANVSTVAAAGAINDIQYHGGGGNLAGNSLFQVDVANNALSLNGLKLGVKQGPVTIFDNQVAPTLLALLTPDTFDFLWVKYSILRGGETQTGMLMLSNNGTIVAISDQNAPTAALGIVFSADLSGGYIRLLYTSTSTGNNGTFQYSVDQW